MRKKFSSVLKLPFSYILKLAYLLFKFYSKQTLSEPERYFLTFCNLLFKTDFKFIASKNRIYINHNGVSAVIRPFPSSDMLVFNQIFLRNEYKSVVTLLKQRKIKKTIIVDAGANIGLALLYFFQHMGNDILTYVAIEPDPGNVSLLRENIERNHITQAYIEQAGVFNENCYLRVTSQFRDKKEWSFQVEKSFDQTSIRGVQLKDIFAGYRMAEVDLLKMDIEGSEMLLFEDANYASEWLKPVRTLAVEIHDEGLVREKIQEQLANNHFHFFQDAEYTIATREKGAFKS